MKKKNPFTVVLILLVLLTGHAACAPHSSTRPAYRLRHDPSRPYRAWVIGIDTSLSPREVQFKRLLAAAEGMVESDVSYNDLIWLIPIQSGLGQTEAFAMPAGSAYRSKRDPAAAGLAEAKRPLLAAIRNMRQTATTTDLQSAIEAALDILRNCPGATRMTLIMGSDFLVDRGNGKVSLDPPERSRPAGFAEGVVAILLVTYPTEKYLQRLGVSPSGLVANVESKWTPYLIHNGAATVRVLPLDAALPLALGALGASPAAGNGAGLSR